MMAVPVRKYYVLFCLTLNRTSLMLVNRSSIYGGECLEEQEPVFQCRSSADDVLDIAASDPCRGYGQHILGGSGCERWIPWRRYVCRAWGERPHGRHVGLIHQHHWHHQLRRRGSLQRASD